MATQMRIYTTFEGKLDDWIRLFRTKVNPLRERRGFRLEAAWAIPERSQFLWILTYPGAEEEFAAADAAYYELPEHAPLHQEALGYLAGADAVFVDAV
jgi:hypothetical protein